jgi:hypothetical protein
VACLHRFPRRIGEKTATWALWLPLPSAQKRRMARTQAGRLQALFGVGRVFSYEISTGLPREPTRCLQLPIMIAHEADP